MDGKARSLEGRVRECRFIGSRQPIGCMKRRNALNGK